jgi:hypothetical protein
MSYVRSERGGGDMIAPAALIDYLQSELDKALARQPDDDARLVMLAKAWGSWSERYRLFCRDGEQPLGGAHPEHGEMSAADFIIVLGMIDGARAKIERRAVAA